MCRFPEICRKVNACNYQNHPTVLVTCSVRSGISTSSCFNMLQVTPVQRGTAHPFQPKHAQKNDEKRTFATSKCNGNKHWSNRRHDNITSDTHACHTQNTTLPQKKKLLPRTGHNTAESEGNTCHAQDTNHTCQDKIFRGKKCAHTK